ncbi:hypothetical protein NPIL_542231 [Nephila pilipes]|uniref:Uncharacterized protein n=1 Tax=Nephila pilipes TaxID=299642 RepID=A0A8X6PSK9_NEPPI|nr:hypothetical protein NPIL_542231 [Nephila pilipes]
MFLGEKGNCEWRPTFESNLSVTPEQHQAGMTDTTVEFPTISTLDIGGINKQKMRVGATYTIWSRGGKQWHDVHVPRKDFIVPRKELHEDVQN